MSEDYTYEPLGMVTVERSELDYLRAELSRLRRQVGELEGENTALRDGYREMEAALAAAKRANAELRSGIAGIRQHGGIIANGDVLLDNIAG